MSSSSESFSSTTQSQPESYQKFIVEGLLEPLVKGTICGMAHLLVFMVLKRKLCAG